MKACFLMLLIFGAQVLNAQTGIVLNKNFDDGNLRTGWHAIQTCCSHSMQLNTTIKKSGGYSLRAELNRSDNFERSEVVHNLFAQSASADTTLKWYSFSTYMPSNEWTVDPAEEIFAQWHENHPNCATNPPLSLMTINGKFRISIYNNSNYPYCSNLSKTTWRYFDIGNITYDRWNDWVVFYNPRWDNQGQIVIWLNGVKVLDYVGPCWFNQSYGNYFKLGVYKWIWQSNPSRSTSTKRVIYIDDVKIGNKFASPSNFVPSTSTNQAPVANAGGNRSITLPTNSVILNGGNSFDPDGSISRYQWSQVSGPSSATLTNATSASLTASNLIQGTYSFRLTVTDNNGASASATANVVVNPATIVNQPPIANAGGDRSITLPTNSIILNGTGSSDPDGVISRYQWSQVSGPNTATLTNATTASLTASNLVAGTYSFRLTVTDNAGLTASATANVTVSAATTNQAPIANAGGNRSITLPTNSIILNGTGSSDPDGVISRYQWSQVSGPNTATLTNATTASLTASNLVAGTYSFRLTVTDNAGLTASATANVTVNAATTNQVPVANAGGNRSITLPTNSITLSGTGSFDPDGSISRYQWTQASGPSTATLTNAGTATLTASNLVQGTYSFRLTVTDNLGATASATASVTVNAATTTNLAPTANTGVPEKTITMPKNYTMFSGTLSRDSDGSIVRYQWSQVSGPNNATLSGATNPDVSLTNLVAGTYFIRLTVTDDKGATGSATARLNVLSSTAVSNKIAPVAVTAGRITTEGSSVALEDKGSFDRDGQIITRNWTQKSGPNTAAIESPTSGNTKANGLIPGTYIFELEVTDNDGLTGTSLLTVEVTEPVRINQPPVVITEDSLSINWPANSVTLDGSKSYDSDGNIVLFQWRLVNGPSTPSFSTPNSATSEVSNLKAGTYVFSLSVKDNEGAINRKELILRVNKNGNGNEVDVDAVKLYPNPVSSSLNMRLDGSQTGKATVKFYNMSGLIIMQDVIQKTSSSYSKSYDLSQFLAGSYLISVQFENSKTPVLMKFIKL